MWYLRRRTAGSVAGIVAVVAALALVVGSSLGSTSPRHGVVGFGHPSPVVPVGDLLAISLRGRLLVLNHAGREVKRLPGVIGGPQGLAQAIELAPDRRHAWVSVWNAAAMTFHMFSLDLATGRRQRLPDGVNPTMNAQRTMLAYARTSRIADGDPGETALVIEDLRSGRTRTIPFGVGTAFGTPPELIISWSPDGRHVAVYTDKQWRYRLVDIRTASTVASSPALPQGVLAPVYLSDHTVVVDANCCAHTQQLVTLNIQTGRKMKLARISSPVQTVHRLGATSLLITDALGELVRVTGGRVQILRSGIDAVSP
jgi:hypothetical protein